jgi:hypothetical protein
MRVPNRELNQKMSPTNPPLGKERTPLSSIWSPIPLTTFANSVTGFTPQAIVSPSRK